MDIITVLTLIATLLMAVLTLVYFIPETRVSTYRTKLWQIRDEIMELRLSGNEVDDAFADDAERLVQDIHRRIQYARELTPYRFLTMLVAVEASGYATNIPKLPPKSITLLSYHDRVQRADVTHFLTGSWSAVAATIVLLPSSVIALAVTRVLRRPHPRKEVIPDDRIEGYYEALVVRRSLVGSSAEHVTLCV